MKDIVNYEERKLVFEDKKERRIDRLENLSDKAEKNSVDCFKQSIDMTSGIPMGQPILPGKRGQAHINLLDRSWNKLGQSVSESNKSEYYKNRAESAKNNNNISSGDPDAIKKLKDKLENLEKTRAYYKIVNAAWRKYLKTKNIKDLEIAEIKEPQKIINQMAGLESWQQKKVFPSFMSSNLSQNIRTVKQRIEKLVKVEKVNTDIAEGKTPGERLIDGLRIVNNIIDNRLQIFFPGKPSQNVRNVLKSYGFRWSSLNECWQAFRSVQDWKIEEVIKAHQKEL